MRIKKYLLVLFVLSSLFAAAQASVWDGRQEVWSNGAGTENNPYLIESADNMAFLAYMVNKGYETAGMFFRLTIDIDLDGEDQPWEPIGLGDRWANEDGCDRGMLESGSSFRGHFDGGGHRVFNLHVEDGFTNAGLFGFVVGQSDAPAVIENVFVVSGSVLGSNCGGVVGNGNFVQVNRCWNGASVEGARVGGVIGTADDVTINNCYNVGNILGVGDNAVAGGLVGIAQSDVQLSNSYNAGDVFGANHIGCLVGDGDNGTTNVENCHYLNTCSQSECGTPQEESFMQSMDFVYLLNGQDEEPVWAFDVNGNNNGFPILAEEVYSSVMQTLELSAGWNWVSFNVEITMDDLKTAILSANPGATIVIKSKGDGQASYNGIVWVGALRDVDVSQMYEIKVANACMVTLEGTPIDPASHPVTIKNGANWIAYPLNETMSVASTFAGFAAMGDNVKSKIEGQATWNNVIWTGALSNLMPGHGYIYTSATSVDRTFTFPMGD